MNLYKVNKKGAIICFNRGVADDKQNLQKCEMHICPSPSVRIALSQHKIYRFENRDDCFLKRQSEAKLSKLLTLTCYESIKKSSKIVSLSDIDLAHFSLPDALFTFMIVRLLQFLCLLQY